MNRNIGGMMMWVAQCISAGIYRILEKEPAGSVHSVFNTSFNLIFGEKLVHVGALDNGLAPFGIGLEQMDSQMLTRKMKQAESVTWNASDNILRFAGGEILMLKRAVTTDHSLFNRPFSKAILKNNFDYTISNLFHDKWQTGLVQTQEEKEILLQDMLSPITSLTDHAALKELANLSALVQGKEKSEAVHVFNYWIGRGPGLTPSGDDVMTGICAILSVLQDSKGSFKEELESYVLQYGRQRTTQVGVEYLSYATKNEYHSHLVQLCKSLLNPQKDELLTALDEMRKMGHTSGTDTLIGILLGMKVVLDREDILDG